MLFWVIALVAICFNVLAINLSSSHNSCRASTIGSVFGSCLIISVILLISYSK